MFLNFNHTQYGYYSNHRVTRGHAHVRHVRKHRLGNDDVPFIKIGKNRRTQTDDGAPNREP